MGMKILVFPTFHYIWLDCSGSDGGVAKLTSAFFRYTSKYWSYLRVASALILHRKTKKKNLNPCVAQACKDRYHHFEL